MKLYQAVYTQLEPEDIVSLESFEIASALKFETNDKGVPFGIVDNDDCQAKFSLLGGHVCDYTPRGSEPLLFVSDSSNYALGKAIRGGIPVCFPWFGPAKDADGQTDETKPAHGIVRTQLWELLATNHTNAGTEVSLAFQHADFRVTNTVRFGNTLNLDFTIENLQDSEQRFELALHTYFSVGDATQIEIRGLEHTPFLDQLTGETHQGSGLPIRFSEETDRIYQGVVEAVKLHDPTKNRSTSVRSSGSGSTVIWNPWIAKSKRMADFGDTEYPRMVCIETANIGENSINLTAGESHTTEVSISTCEL
ncbi:MAG: D-hexose-6-phosphate mutarotase [Pirellulaceae bacterium]